LALIALKMRSDSAIAALFKHLNENSKHVTPHSCMQLRTPNAQGTSDAEWGLYKCLYTGRIK